MKKSISCRIKTIKIIPIQTLLLSDLVYIFATNKQNIKAMRYTEERYEDSLKAFRDMRNTLDNAKKEGFEEGLIKGERNKAMEIATKNEGKRLFCR